MSDSLADLFKLSPAERIQLAEDLWTALRPTSKVFRPFRIARKARSNVVSRSTRVTFFGLDWTDVRARSGRGRADTCALSSDKKQKPSCQRRSIGMSREAQASALSFLALSTRR